MIGILKQKLRALVLTLFQKARSTEELILAANKASNEYKAVRDSIANAPNPYHESRPKAPDRYIENTSKPPPIFITGRFRSGSTLLWNLMRETSNITAYYEPFNERRWFAQSQRGDHTDRSHRGVADYWAEYRDQEALSHLYNEDWIRRDLYMDKAHFDLGMKQYIQALIDNSKDRAALQFNRVDFRLEWLTYNFPQALIIHIYRNPRDQWCSFLGDMSIYPSECEDHTVFQDHFYLRVWYRDLCRQFPFLVSYESSHQYYLFYFIWKLSYLYGTLYSTRSICYEDLVQSSEATVRQLLTVINEPDYQIGHLVDIIDRKAASKWGGYATDSWFTEIELECESVIDEFFNTKAGPHA